MIVAEVKTPPTITKNGDGDDLVTFGPEHTLADIARYFAKEQGALPEILDILKDELGENRAVSKYHRIIHGKLMDVYDVLTAWQVTCPATAHAIKKLMMPGNRGHKGRLQDLREARDSIDRAIALASDKTGNVAE
jgi:hypothetical protein